MIRRKARRIPERYIPERSTGPEPGMNGHETRCIPNTAKKDATVEIAAFFPDHEPVVPHERTVPSERTEHLRVDEFEASEPLSKGEPFATVIESDTSIVCQHTELDSRQAENALLSTIASPGGGGES